MPTDDADPDATAHEAVHDPARSIEAEILAEADEALGDLISLYESVGDQAVLRAVIEVLDGRGPMPIGSLVADLRDRGVLDYLGDLDDLELTTEIDDMLIGFVEVMGYPTELDHLVAHTRTLFEELVFTHRLTALERRTGFLDAHPDLVYLDFPFRRLAMGSGEFTMVFDFVPEFRIGDDADMESDGSEHGSIRGPAGWLDPFDAGDLVAIVRRGASAEVFRVDEAELDEADAERQRAALRVAADDLVGAGRSAEPWELLQVASLADPDAFKRLGPPLRELFDEIGLEGRGAWYGRAGEEFTTIGDNSGPRGPLLRSMRFGFATCCEEQYDSAFRAWAEVGLRQAEIGHDQLVDAAEALAHSEVASALIDEVLGDWQGRSEPLDRFADQVIALGGTRCAPGLFIRALGEELDGDALAAEASLEAAVRADASLAPALRALAMFVAERGDAARALRLFRRAEVDSGQEIDMLVELTSAPTGIGRNSPCPCGSGRKFKQCCQRAPRITPRQRAKWLLHRLVTFLARPQRSGTFRELVWTAASEGGPDSHELHRKFSSDPTLTGLALFQTELLADYADERGPLLDDVDRQLLDSWQQTGYALHEISAVEPGVSITMRDTTSADVVTVDEDNLSYDAEAGQWVLGVVGDVGGGRQEFLSAATLLTLQERDTLLPVFDEGASAERLAAWYGSQFAPPTVLDTEGDSTVTCRAFITYGLEADEVDRRLTGHFGPPADGEAEDGVGDAMVWHTYRPDDEDPLPGRTIRSIVHRVGDRLRLDANSERRFDEALLDLHDLLGEPTFFEENREPLGLPRPAKRTAI